MQQWYNFSDPQIEREIRDRISLIKFLGFPEKLSDRNTVWYFRERLSRTGRDRIIWNELEGIRVKNGSAQDATFITADLRSEIPKKSRDIIESLEMPIIQKSGSWRSNYSWITLYDYKICTKG